VTVTVDVPPAPAPAPAPAAGPRRGRAPLNPVLAREVKDRLRGRRAWITLTAFLVVLSLICFLVYDSNTATGGVTGDPFAAPSPTQFASAGRAVFEWVLFFMLLLVLFLVPGLTSGAIAGERERQTLVPLQVTMLRPWQIVAGKLAASFAFLALLVVATLPIVSVAYLIGGVSIGTVLRGVAVVLFTGLVLACLTLLCSAVFRRVQAATVAAYGMVLLLSIGTFLVWGAADLADRSRGSDPGNPPVALLVLNPVFATADVLGDGSLFDGSSVASPFEPMQRLLVESRTDGGVVFGGGFGGFDGGGRPIIGFDANGNPIFAEDQQGFPFWAQSCLALYVVAALALVLAGRRLRTPAAVER
jgi:ABC-type transport system involved in multi-copper enzyme maturation permease subunit